MAQAPDEPDWSIWSKADAVELQDAVALSIDIGPGGERHQHAKMGKALYCPARPNRDDYHERLTLSLSHIGRDLPLAGPPLPPEMPQETSKVRLSDFAAFASRMGWELADNFPWKEMTYVDDKGNKVTLVNVDGKQMVRTPAGGYISQEQWHAMTHPPREPAPPMPPWLDTSPDVDWKLWAPMAFVELPCAVALSCDIDPSSTPCDDPEFLRRLAIAINHWDAGTIPRVAGPGSNVPGYLLRYVRLPDFAKLADSLGWPLPAAFPRSKNGDPPKTAQPVMDVKPAQPSEPASGNDITTPPEKTVDLTENARETLLTIIAGAIGDNLENPSTAAKTIERRLEKWGIDSPKHRQILNWLNEAKQALDKRKAKD
jgi:hypothetical protein